MNHNTINLEQLISLQQKPEPFTPGEPLFWDDPYISQQMLAAHLDSATEAASRSPETIDRMVAWIVETLDLRPGDTALDLGCGPGLYASRLAERGLRVTGVDYSRRSIEYARQEAHNRNLKISYRYENYLALEDESLHDAAFLIYGDYCPLAPENRALLLRNVYRALKPGGSFILDVTTRELRMKYGLRKSWNALSNGFWRAGPHLVLEQGFDYHESSLYLNQYIVIEPYGCITVYRNWFQDFSKETITAELEKGGFTVDSLWGGLAGETMEENPDWIGVVARKG